jgi:hypothetical protein
MTAAAENLNGTAHIFKAIAAHSDVVGTAYNESCLISGCVVVDCIRERQPDNIDIAGALDTKQRG